jgi:hypothetical protein
VTAYARDLWERAAKTLTVAETILSLDPDSAASRAYYAAFYAVSAHFALQDETFARHSALEGAVHRDLVKPGIWSKELGAAYSRLSVFRWTADYGGSQHVQARDAEEAVRSAAIILQAVARLHPETFSSQKR